MKLLSLVLCALCVLFGQVRTTSAQRAISGSGGGSSVGVVRPPADSAPRKVVKITYTAITPLRAWKNKEGKVITGHLLAWDPPGGAPAEAAEPDAPAPPPIVLREEKVRLLVDKKVFEIPLATLSAEDQAFVEKLVASAEARRSAPPRPSSPETP